jgi:hypothetical protein
MPTISLAKPKQAPAIAGLSGAHLQIATIAD